MTGLMLDPRTATAYAIAKAQTPYAGLSNDATGPTVATIRNLAHDRFALDLTDAEIRAAIEEATQR